MVTLEKLRKIRAKEGEDLKKLSGRLAEKREKAKLKEDIRKIRGAKMRAYTGMDSDAMDKYEKAFKSTVKGTGKALKFGFGTLMSAGAAANEYYGPKRKRRR